MVFCPGTVRVKRRAAIQDCLDDAMHASCAVPEPDAGRNNRLTEFSLRQSVQAM